GPSFHQPLRDQNPEVLHRWYEIVLKFYVVGKKKQRRRGMIGDQLEELKRYLRVHPAMGVYLYGEMMISEKRKLQGIARELYYEQRELFDPETRRILQSMIF